MFKSVGMPEFYQESKRNKVTIIDVRETFEYEMGHIPESINMPLSELGETFETLEKETPYFLICQSGSRSATAGEFLGMQGYDVTNILGGMGSWPGDIE
ncbi:rhodanese-like domain-containing protein [Vagococcus fluvialis]|uniref:rhodanese-like domain-containing protein n=1 Tax=Vagococcus fluvialis TaxID=2738 RepID=UPI003B5C596C